METPEGKVGISECMRSFEPYLAMNRRTEKPVIHLSLNPHPDDVLSDEQLEAIGREYMDRLGYGDQPYIIFRHDDNARPHIHIVSLRIDEQGRKLRVTRNGSVRRTSAGSWKGNTACCSHAGRNTGFPGR